MVAVRNVVLGGVYGSAPSIESVFESVFRWSGVLAADGGGGSDEAVFVLMRRKLHGG